VVRHPARSETGYVVCGHAHPAVRLAGAGRERKRLACFWFGAGVAVLPAFGELTRLADSEPAPGDQVWVIAADVVRVTCIREL
jgi:metallophosphoesterase superfamily enzyme